MWKRRRLITGDQKQLTRTPKNSSTLKWPCDGDSQTAATTNPPAPEFPAPLPHEMENAASLFLFSFQRPENISVIPTKTPSKCLPRATNKSISTSPTTFQLQYLYCSPFYWHWSDPYMNWVWIAPSKSYEVLFILKSSLGRNAIN